MDKNELALLKKRSEAACGKLRRLSQNGSYTHDCQGWLCKLDAAQTNAEYSDKYLPMFSEMVGKSEAYLIGIASNAPKDGWAEHPGLVRARRQALKEGD
jgi:hypothetical protein